MISWLFKPPLFPPNAQRTELTGLLIAEEARRAAVEDELENVVRVALQESQQAHTELVGFPERGWRGGSV